MRVRRVWKAQMQARIGGVTEGSILEVHTLVSSAVQRVKETFEDGLPQPANRRARGHTRRERRDER